MASGDTRLSLAKEFLSNPFVTFLLFLVGGLIISIAPDKQTQVILYMTVGMTFLTAIGFYIIYFERISRRKISNQYGVLAIEKQNLQRDLEVANREIQRQPRVAYYALAQKTAKLLNGETGDADIHYYFECTNSRNILRTMRHEIKYDGKESLKRSDIEASVNGVKADFNFSTITNCEVKGTTHTIKKYVTAICIKPDPPIGKDQKFNYEYTMRSAGTYPNAAKDDSEFSSHSVMHQTDLLRFRLHAPEKYEFTRCWIEIQDYNGTRDPIEENSCLCPNCGPKKLNGNRELLWEIKDPKVTYTYKLYFKISILKQT